MGLFGRKPATVPGPQDDQGWLSAGYARYEQDVSKHYGSPETLAAGGDAALRSGDVGAAVFFYAKAVDVAQTRWSSESRVVSADVRLFTQYVNAIESVGSSHPGADLLGDRLNNNGRYTANMMRGIAMKHFQAGDPTQDLDAQINRFLQVTGMPVPDHW